MNHFETLTEAMENLRERGYTAEFAPKGDFLEEVGSGHQVKSDDFHVDEFHRFEGTSDPGDEMTLFGITTGDGLKGVFVFGMGAYANEASAALMQKFSLADRPDVNTDGAVKPIRAVGLAEGGE